MYPPLLRCLGKERLIQRYYPHLNYLHDFLADSDGSDHANLRGQGARGTKASATFKFIRFGSVKGPARGDHALASGSGSAIGVASEGLDAASEASNRSGPHANDGMKADV
jgi:hypothetical protein